MIVWSLLFLIFTAHPVYDLLIVLIAAIMLWYLAREQSTKSEVT